MGALPGLEERGEEEELGEEECKERGCRRRGAERRARARRSPSRTDAGEGGARSDDGACEVGRDRGTRVKKAATERSGACAAAVTALRPRLTRGAPAL